MALKVSKRNGWIHRGMKECESIADHSYRMGVMALLVDPKMYDISKVYQFIIKHIMYITFNVYVLYILYDIVYIVRYINS